MAFMMRNDELRGTHPRHCHCGTRLAADQRGPLCSPCQRRSAGNETAAPSVPAGFWLAEPMAAALAARHIGKIIHAYRLHPWHGRVIPQTVAAAWARTDQAQVSRIEAGPPVHDLRRLAHWARVLRIPPRLLWFELPPPATAGQAADAEGVSPTRRRDLIAFSGLTLAGPAAERLERELDLVHLTLDRGTTSEERTAQLERAARDLSVRVENEDARNSVNPAMRTLGTVRALLEERQPTGQQARLVRVSAMLSVVVGEVLFDTGNLGRAREWYLAAGHAARDAGDQYLTDIALARQALIPTYSGDPHGVLALVGPRLEQQPAPSPAAAWLRALAARAHATLGDLAGFQRSIHHAHKLMADSPPGLIGPGTLSRRPANIFFYEATGAVALRQPDAAITAADQALAHALSPGDTDRILVPLERASALAQSGEVPEACRVAAAALLQPDIPHDASVRAYAARFDAAIRGIQSPQTREWRQVLADARSGAPAAATRHDD
jgi:hypothetical protein